MKKLIILDRDGVINHDSLHYIKSVEEFKLIPGSIEAIVRLVQADYQVAIATNQSGISRGYYDEPMLSKIHDTLLQEVRAAGGDIAAIEYCPHMPDAGCVCRKPNPGMLHAIANRLNYDLAGVRFIGDRISDIQAAVAADAIPMLVLSPMTSEDQLQAYPQVSRFHSLLACVEQILDLDG